MEVIMQHNNCLAFNFFFFFKVGSEHICAGFFINHNELPTTYEGLFFGESFSEQTFAKSWAA